MCDICGGHVYCNPDGCYVGFLIYNNKNAPHPRMYAGKIMASGTKGYLIATPGGQIHHVRRYRIRCIEPLIFNRCFREQLRKKRFDISNISTIQTNDYMDFGVFTEV